MHHLPRTREEHEWLALRAALAEFGDPEILAKPQEGFVIASILGVEAAGPNILEAAGTVVEKIAFPTIKA